MRPVRFVALSEDGQAFVLADEVGRLLALPNDERISAALRHDRSGTATAPASGATAVATQDAEPSLSPRDIQARIRSGESAEDVARAAGVPVDRVLRYAGPVLQERAMLAQHARRTKLRSADKGSVLADVVDGRLAQHGVDSDKIAWDAYRREDGTWRIVATWPSGKATAQAIWELDKTRQHVTPYDDMAQYLCTERPMPILGQDPPIERPGRGLATPARPESSGRGDLGRSGGHEPMRPSAPRPESGRPGRGLTSERRLAGPAQVPAHDDPIRSGRDALMASLDRPLTTEPPPGTPAAPGELARPARPAGGRSGAPGEVPGSGVRTGGAAALLGGPPAGGARGAGPGSAFDDDPDAPKEVPAVPSLAVLRPRRAGTPAGPEQPGTATDKPRKRLPSWDDVLFGSAPAARESS